MADKSAPDPDEIVTLRRVAHDGANLEIEMPRWAFDSIQRGEGYVLYRGGRSWESRDADGNVTRHHTLD